MDVLRSFVSTSVADRLVASGGRFGEERRLVTALFADLSGFTTLATRLDPEQLLEVIDPVLQGLTDVIADYGGHVEKFAGDALLALFGAPVAHDDDADRALRTALEMHRRLAETSPLPPGELTLHVGINSGHVVARVIGGSVRLDYAVLGDTVVLAQRIESQTPTGQTYVGETTKRLADARFEFEPVGPLVLKGRPQPEPAWRLVRERARVGAGEQVYGRAEELTRVGAVLEEAAAGRGGAVLVSGEPGAGKSHLVSAAQHAGPGRAMRWVSGQCLTYGAALPYRPYVDIVRTLTADRPTNPYLDHLLGRPGSDLPGQGPEALRRGIHAAVLSLLAEAAAAGPVVCLLEDMHWADPSSIDLTEELRELAHGRPLAVLLTARPDEVGPGLAGLLADLPTVPLEAMDRPALEQIARDVLAAVPPPALVDVLVDRCAGNPLFARELTRSLRDDGLLAERNGCWRLTAAWQSAEVPDTVEGVLAARMDRLPPGAAEVLQAAAVLGRRVRLPLLAALVPAAALAVALPLLLERGLLVEGAQGVEFHHALMQEAAYARLLRKRRRELHQRTAAAATELYGDGDDVIELLARHLYLGGAGAPAVEALRRAGVRSRELFANEEAALHYCRAVEVCRREPDLAGQLPDLLKTVAELNLLRGEYEAASEAYSEVVDLVDDAAAWAGLASTLRRHAQLAQAEQVLDRALSAPRAGDVRALWFERSWLLSVLSRRQESEAAALTGLALFPQPPDRLAGQLLLCLALLETEDGRAEQAVQHAQTALEALELADDLPGQAYALRLLGGALETAGRYEEAFEVLTRGLDIAERVGSIEEVCGCLVNLGNLALQSGEFAAGIGHTRRALEELRRINHRVGLAVASGNLGELLLGLGDLGEAEQRLDEALLLSRDVGYEGLVADVLHNRARVAEARGRPEVAARRAEEAAEAFERDGLLPRAAESRRYAARQWRAAGGEERALRAEQLPAPG